jgi:hypothetical protein
VNNTEKPAFDEAEARRLFAHIENPACQVTHEAGLRAIWAVQHTKLFDKPKEAWEYYQSSKQRYYEWKACMLPNDLLVNAATQLPVHVIG